MSLPYYMQHTEGNGGGGGVEMAWTKQMNCSLVKTAEQE